MKLTSYWLETAPSFTASPIAALPGSVDAVVVGGDLAAFPLPCGYASWVHLLCCLSESAW